MLPIAAPAVGALTIFVFQVYWNDFFWANIFLFSQDKATLPLGLVRLQGLYGTTSPVVIFAAITMVLLPILVLFIFTQRFLTENLARSGLKG
jgi:ABC-type glycerol-3-phosphate transport system permease component